MMRVGDDGIGIASSVFSNVEAFAEDAMFSLLIFCLTMARIGCYARNPRGILILYS